MAIDDLKNAFDYIKEFYKEIAQMLTDLNDLMAKQDWVPMGSSITDELSYSLDRPEKWFVRHVFENYVNEKINDHIKGILIFFAREDFPPGVVFGSTKVSPKYEYKKWALWNIWADNKEKLRELNGKQMTLETECSDGTISGEVISIPLEEIKSHADLEAKVYQKLLEI